MLFVSINSTPEKAFVRFFGYPYGAQVWNVNWQMAVKNKYLET